MNDLKKTGRYLVDTYGVDTGNVRLILIGPLIFLVVLVLPIPGFDLQSKGGLGVLLWMTFWWTTGFVAVAITALVPILVTTFFPIAPVEEIVSVFSHRLVFLIAGSGAIGVAWRRWGLAKRIALKLLIMVGNDVRKQIWAWFLIAAFLSSFITDTITAVVFVPIAITLLNYSGFDTNNKRWNSSIATNILLAIAWGASIGSLPTPLGGGQNLLIYEFLSNTVNRNIYFYEWTIRMLPFTLVLLPLIGFYLSHILQRKNQKLPGSKEAYQKELKAMGKIKKGEVYSGIAFILAILSAFLEPVYSKYINFIDPAFIFFSLGIILFFVPTETKENVLSIKSMKNFPITILIVWPSALALAKLLEQSGLANIITENFLVFSNYNNIMLFLILCGVTTILTNISTNTASAALIMPLIIQHFVEVGQNSVPIIFALTVAVNLSFAIASGNGCLAVTAGYGVNLRKMFKHGIIIAFISFLITSVLSFLLNKYIPWWGLL
ncbi:MAG: SLC13 family permease [Bacillota bacterium]